jgi:hypothetical protein
MEDQIIFDRLKCPFCGIPTIDDKEENIEIEEYTCTDCFIKHFFRRLILNLFKSLLSLSNLLSYL